MSRAEAGRGPLPGSGQDGKGVRLFIDPPSHHFTRDRLFESSSAPYGGDDLMAPHRAVRDALTSAGIPTHTLDAIPADADGHLDIIASFGQWRGLDYYRELARRPGTVLSAYIPLECPIVDPDSYRRLPEMSRLFRRVFSWGDPDEMTPFVGTRIETEAFHWPQSFDAVHEGLWSRADRGFLMMMNSNKLPRIRTKELYTERMRAVEFFDRYGEIDLYGRYWDRPSIKVGKTVLPATARRGIEAVHRFAWKIRQRVLPDPVASAAVRANRGPVSSKSEVQSRYRFAVCFENMVLDGWITEKIFDCFFTGTIPIYLGAPDILEKVPAECFVDMREFKGYPELRAYLHALTPQQIDRYREAARAYLASPRFDPFRKATFVDLFRRLVAADAGAAV